MALCWLSVDINRETESTGEVREAKAKNGGCVVRVERRFLLFRFLRRFVCLVPLPSSGASSERLFDLLIDREEPAHSPSPSHRRLFVQKVEKWRRSREKAVLLHEARLSWPVERWECIREPVRPADGQRRKVCPPPLPSSSCFRSSTSSPHHRQAIRHLSATEYLLRHPHEHPPTLSLPSFARLVLIALTSALPSSSSSAPQT